MRATQLRAIHLGVILLLGGLGTFVLPWHVPVKEVSASLSYTYGFNNTVAVLAVGCTLLALLGRACYLRLHGADESGFTGAVEETLRVAVSRLSDRRLWISCFAASAGFCALISLWYWYAPFYRFGEMSYFLNRIDLLLIGHAPYVGYPFYYGPAMLYLPMYLYHGAHGLLSIEQSYFVLLLAHWVAGLFLLGYSVGRLFPAGRRVFAFWIFALIFFNPSLGYNYTPLRYIMPLAGLLWTFAVVSRADKSIGSHARVCLAAFVTGFVNFELSPEMGLAATVGLVLYFVGLSRTDRRGFVYGFIFALLGAGIAVAPWSAAYIGVLFSFGGGNNVPVLPGLGVLLLLGAAVVMIPRLAVFGFFTPGEEGAAALALCVLTGLLLDPALGRCDLGHVFINGSVLFILAAAVYSRVGDGRAGNRLLWALFLVFAFFGEWVFLYHSAYMYRNASAARAWMRAHPIAGMPESHGFKFSKRYPPADGLEALASFGTLETPLECPENVERFLFLHGEFATPFNPGYNPDTLTLKETEKRLGELDSLKRIVVPKVLLYPVTPPDTEAARTAKDLRFLRSELMFPLLHLSPRNPFFDPQEPENEKILRDFSVKADVDGFLVMDRRAGSDAGAPDAGVK